MQYRLYGQFKYVDDIFWCILGGSDLLDTFFSVGTHNSNVPSKIKISSLFWKYYTEVKQFSNFLNKV